MNYLPTTHFWYMTLKHWGYFHWKVHSNWWDCVIDLDGEKVFLVHLYKDVWRTDRCAWCELAMRLKCAIMVTYDSEELGPCCEKHWTHLTNGLHILLSFPRLTPNKCASDSGGGGKSLRLQCHCRHANARATTELTFSVFQETKVKGTSVQNIMTPCKERLLQSLYRKISLMITDIWRDTSNETGYSIASSHLVNIQWVAAL